MIARFLAVLLLASAWAGHADSSVDKIEVTGPRFSGYWNVVGPNLIEFKLGLLSGINIIYSGETVVRDICLIQRTDHGFVTICSAGSASAGGGSLARDEVRLSWSNGPAELIFTGHWDENDTIAGAFSGGLAGMRVTGHIPATLHKLEPASAPDGGAHAAVLREVLNDLRQGVLVRQRYEPGAIKRVWRAEQWREAKDAVGSVNYLGVIHVHWQKKQPELLEEVYEVRSGNRLSLCRISFSEHGLVNDFACHDGNG